MIIIVHPEKYKFSISQIKSEQLPGKASYLELDLSDLESVRACANKINSEIETISALVNNAGIMMPPKKITKHGFESQFGINHLGHFLLTELLLNKLLASSPSRVINVSSVGTHA